MQPGTARFPRSVIAVIGLAIFFSDACLALCPPDPGGARQALEPAQVSATAVRPRPNVILCMADDLGWGDPGYNGHPTLRTPHLDQMAREGIRFNRFYAAAPVCSPTRGSCLTGRHPYRYGVYSANVGHLKPQEITLAELLKPLGYATGHFGKWHLGTLTKAVRDGRRGGRQNQHYSPPWEHGFEVCFSTEQAVPTWDPVRDQAIPTRYWIGPGEAATENLAGDDSRVIMDRVIPFIRAAAEARRPFFAVIWFHTPHSPVRAGPAYRALYGGEDEDHQHYYGCITAMDEQIGRLRAELRTLGTADNTMLWFCSDNGPAGEGGGTRQTKGGRQQGLTGLFRGRKGSLYEGGIRVPGLLVWPARITEPRQTDYPVVTSDFLPTILAALDQPSPETGRPRDGLDLLPLLEGRSVSRPRPIGFLFGRQMALCDNRWKLLSNDRGATWELYDLAADPGEQTDLAARHPDLASRMAAQLNRWRASCQASDEGKDYEKP